MNKKKIALLHEHTDLDYKLGTEPPKYLMFFKAVSK